MKSDFILKNLKILYPNPKCALIFSSPFQALVAVLLSAQTTDKAVNKITPSLFTAYPDPFSLSKANIKDVEKLIHSIGLYHNKAANLISMSEKLVKDYEGKVPDNKKDLTQLPGVGNKTANVVLAECFKVPSIAVDTHVKRVSYRLGLAKQKDTPETIEKKLERQFDKEDWIRIHHSLIWFGRDICHAKKPKCDVCPFRSECYFLKKTSKTAGR